jgi:hypothetical protein
MSELRDGASGIKPHPALEMAADALQREQQQQQWGRRPPFRMKSGEILTHVFLRDGREFPDVSSAFADKPRGSRVVIRVRLDGAPLRGADFEVLRP